MPRFEWRIRIDADDPTNARGIAIVVLLGALITAGALVAIVYLLTAR